MKGPGKSERAMLLPRIPQMDRVNGPEVRKSVGEIADSFFHPSRPSGFVCPVWRKRPIQQQNSVDVAGQTPIWEIRAYA